MPPKRKASSRVQTEPSSSLFNEIEHIDQTLENARSSFTSTSNAYFIESLAVLKRSVLHHRKILKEKGFNVPEDEESLYGALEAQLGNSNYNKLNERYSRISSATTTSTVITTNTEVSVTDNTLRVVKEEVVEELMEEERAVTPPITSTTTDEELENQAIPRTALRLQQLSITRPTRQAHTPKTPSRKLPLFASESNIKRQPEPTAAEARNNAKFEHADELKQKFLQSKVNAAKKAEEKRKAVMERKEELIRKEREKAEERRRKEEKASEFAKQVVQLRSPPRIRKDVLSTISKTPKSKKNLLSEFATSTPGRRPAKYGKVDNAEVGTSAKPTVTISPSRELLRSMKVEKAKHSKETKSEEKPIVKAKRTAPSSKDTNGLCADQEAYLLQQMAKDKAERAAAEEARKIKEAEAERERIRMEEERLRLEEEKRRKEEEEIRKQKEEAEQLRKIQEEEAERLRIQAEKEQHEYELTLKKQEEKLKLGKKVADVYEMTPPRIYKASSKDNYGLDDLNSDDETDQEDAPRKEVPAWADWAIVKRQVKMHFKNPPCDLKKLFKEIPKPNLKTIFGDKIKMKKRGSSAVWRSPITGKANTSKLCDIRE